MKTMLVVILWGTIIIISGTVWGEISPGAVLQGAEDWSNRISYFNSQTGKDHPLIEFSCTWKYEFGQSWPDYIQQTIDAGSVPVLTWMSCGDNIWDSNYPLQDVINGRFDEYIRRSAIALKAYNQRILCRFDQEMNIDIWAWSVNAPWNNGKPLQYVEMWRHVRNIFTEEGVTNVEWIWCPNYMSNPFEAWNDSKNFYPGDGYVDWIGVDGYSWGSSNASGNSQWAVSFPCLFDPIIREFQCNYKKPIILCEFGCLEDARYPKSNWIRDSYDYLSHYPFIKGIIWLNTYNPTTGSQEDFRAVQMYDDSFGVPGAVTQAYRDGISTDSFITSLPTLEEATPSQLMCDPLPGASDYPKMEVKLNKKPGSVYYTGDVLAPAYFLYQAANADNMFVDPYLVFKLPNGRYYSYTAGGFVGGIVRALGNFGVKRQSRAMAFYYMFNGGIPAGDYILYSALVRKGADPRVASNWYSFEEDSFTYQP